ncbi:MAG: Rne/Rng family ribonuclease [Flavobacteriales bacterium]|jgi:ribonuclease G|nr:Rne/Rng family ribonuclease [Flavobacteriales bacterium]
MNNELVIKSTPQELDIALLHNRRLIELHKETPGENNFTVGDIYLGRVKRIMPALNAAFVDVGYEKDAFLHYHDLGPQVKSLNKFVKRSMAGKQSRWMLSGFDTQDEIDKNGQIGDVLESGQTIAVQVTKEPISTKGPRISTEISIAGRYIVLLPFSDKISISQRIRDREERKRLKRLLLSIKPKGFGIIIRTVAEGKKVADLDADLSELVDKWQTFFKQVKVSKAPFKVLGEMSRTSALLRDIMNDSFDNIYVDSQELHKEIKDYLLKIDPSKENIIQLADDHPAGIFEKFGIERQIKSAFGRSVSMRKGAYLIIDHTEAMHVIDVNSGNRAEKGSSQEENALSVNLLAAEEIARQLRLRDMGGIIVVDFIDMNTKENRSKLFEGLKQFMKQDRAKHKILPPSRFGLVEITRQRVRPEVEITTQEQCPTCKGSGKVEASVLFEDEIVEKIEQILKKQDKKGVTLLVHPFIYSHLTKGGLFSIKWKLMWKYKKKFAIRANSAFHLTQFTFLDNDENVIDI